MQTNVIIDEKGLAMKKSDFDVKVDYPNLDAKEKIKFLEYSLSRKNIQLNFYRVVVFILFVSVIYDIFRALS